jgi:hypothetical protein
MKVAELLCEAKRDPIKLKHDYVIWRKLVNMPVATMMKLINMDEAKHAGLSRKDNMRLLSGKNSKAAARAVIKMKSKSFTEWTTADINWIYRQISYITRMTNADGPLFFIDKSGKRVPSNRLKTMWAYGHIPPGHPPSKYAKFK